MSQPAMEKAALTGQASRAPLPDDAARAPSPDLREAWGIIEPLLRKAGGRIDPVRSDTPDGLPFDYELPDSRRVAGDVLERFADAGLVRRKFYERVYLCPACWSCLLWFREVCAHCGSAGLERVELIHHYPCAGVFRAEAFGESEPRTCPKCRRPLRDIGVDFEYQPGEFVCVSCSKTSTTVPTAGRCGRCDHRFAAHEAVETDWSSFYLVQPTVASTELTSGDAYRFALIALARFVDERDGHLKNHVERVSRYSRILLDGLAERGEIDDPWRDEMIEAIGPAAALHDIGNIAVVDRVLLKRGPLTPAENLILRRHVESGLRWLSPQQESSMELERAARVVQGHHEHWDGTGYPQGLRGEQIPLEARVVAVADAYDALTSARTYRAGVSSREACERIERLAGKHFDPRVVRVLVERIGKVEEVRESLPGDQE